jgi:hypothetical protein
VLHVLSRHKVRGRLLILNGHIGLSFKFETSQHPWRILGTCRHSMSCHDPQQNELKHYHESVDIMAAAPSSVTDLCRTARPLTTHIWWPSVGVSSWIKGRMVAGVRADSQPTLQLPAALPLFTKTSRTWCECYSHIHLWMQWSWQVCMFNFCCHSRTIIWVHKGSCPQAKEHQKD